MAEKFKFTGTTGLVVGRAERDSDNESAAIMERSNREMEPVEEHTDTRGDNF